MMFKNLIYAVVCILISTGCSDRMCVNVCNPLDAGRHLELVELNLSDIENVLKLTGDDKFVIRKSAEEIPYQITYDGKVVFPVTLHAGESQMFVIKRGFPSEYETRVCGNHYPQRVDDICWENDKVGFRVYGFKEENPSGYDIFIIPTFINAFRSFHIDHGYGADFYAVGPTLGAGTSALLDGGEIVYPFCYDEFEILDNGPLRFTMRLRFRPFKYRDFDDVIETRIISIDLGSHFTKTIVSFENLDIAVPAVTGIVVQDKEGRAIGDASKGYIAYPAPKMNFDEFQDIDNGTIFVGNVFPYELEGTGLSYFSDEESKNRGGAKGHMLAYTTCHHDRPLVYYWGFGWDGADMTTYKDWIEHLDTFSAQLRAPLIIKFN